MIERVDPALGRKIDFRITEQEYRLLRICAREKDMSVSRFVRSLITACLAPTLLTTTDDMIVEVEKAQEARTK